MSLAAEVPDGAPGWADGIRMFTNRAVGPFVCQMVVKISSTEEVGGV